MRESKENTGPEAGAWVTIKVPRIIANRVQANKKKTLVPVGRFFETAALKELDRIEAGEAWMSYEEWKKKQP